MAKKNNEPTKKDIEKRLATLRSSYEMYERTKIDTINRQKNAKDKHGSRIYSDENLEETLDLMNTMQEDIKNSYIELGGNVDDLYVTPKRGKGRGINREKLEEIMKRNKELFEEENDIQDISIVEVEEQPAINKETDEIDVISLVDKDVKPETVERKVAMPKNVENIEKVNEVTDGKDVFRMSNINMDITKSVGNNIKYDVIPLPSGGKCYANKIGKLPVSYLTAYDENMIMSPNLYQDGSFLDYIIKSKIMTTKIDTDDLIPSDREAILIWLRASGYGPMYPITAIDKESGKEFSAEFDLSKLKYKPFKLTPDENGHFTYILPNTKDEIKFKYLSYKDMKDITDMSIKEDSSLRKVKMVEIVESLKYYTDNDNDISNELKGKIENAIKYINEYSESLETSDELFYNHLVTNRLTKSIMSVNGVTDRKYIEEYVSYLNIKDATALRRYINENEPGIDMNITVERPESLGGGSVELFLAMDQYLFLNVPKS